MENSSAAEAVLRSVEESLRRFPFSYQGSRTLSGQEEGAFGWVTLNYLDERLTQVSVTQVNLTQVNLTQVNLPQVNLTCGSLPLTGLSAGLGNHGRPGPGRSLHPDQLRL